MVSQHLILQLLDIRESFHWIFPVLQKSTQHHGNKVFFPYSFRHLDFVEEVPRLGRKRLFLG